MKFVLFYKIKQTKIKLQKYFHISSLNQRTMPRAKRKLAKAPILKKTTVLWHSRSYYSLDLSYSKPAPAGVVCRRYQEEYEERLKEQERRRWEKERRSRERTKKEIDREFRDFGLPFLFLQFLHCFSVNFAVFFY